MCYQLLVSSSKEKSYYNTCKGVSSHSKVLKVRRKADEQAYALKKVSLKDLDEKETAAAVNEVRVLASLRHPNVISFKETFISEGSSTLW